MNRSLLFIALIVSSSASMAFNNGPWGNNNNNWMNNMVPWGNQNSMPWNNNNHYRQLPNRGYPQGYGNGFNRSFNYSSGNNGMNGMFAPWNSFYDTYFDGMGNMDLQADFDVKMKAYGKFRGNDNNNQNLNYYGNKRNRAGYNGDYRQFNGNNNVPAQMPAAPAQNIQR